MKKVGHLVGCKPVENWPDLKIVFLMSSPWLFCYIVMSPRPLGCNSDLFTFLSVSNLYKVTLFVNCDASEILMRGSLLQFVLFVTSEEEGVGWGKCRMIVDEGNRALGRA